MDVVPLKVMIGLKNVGAEIHHDFPDWTLLDAGLGGDHRTHQIEKWNYDKRFGHVDDDAAAGDLHAGTSPPGTWLGILLVTQAFALAALAEFPGVVVEMTEAELEDFWNNRIGNEQPLETTDLDELTSLETRKRMMVDVLLPSDPNIGLINDEIIKALDLDDPTPGRKRNPRKTWNDFKAHRGHTVIPSA